MTLAKKKQRAIWAWVCLSATLWAGGASAQTVTFTVAGVEEDAELRRNLERASLLYELANDPAATAQDFIAAAQADYTRLLTALYGDAHYSGVISITIDGQEAATISPLAVPGSLQSIAINVEPGPEFTFGQTDIAPVPSNYPEQDLFRRGEPARTDAVKDAVEEAVDSWRAIGYAKAAPSGQEVTAYHERNELDVLITLQPGEKLTFGTVSATTESAVRPERIVAIAGIPEGETFDPDEVTLATTRLRRTGAFRSAIVEEADRSAPDGSLPMEISVVDQKQRRIGFGAEYSNVEGATLSAFWLHRNLFGGAERFRVEGEVSGLTGNTGGIDYTTSLGFTVPAFGAADRDLTIDLGWERLDEPNYLLQQVTGQIGITQIIDENRNLSYGVGFQNARVEDALGERRYTSFILPLHGELDYRDDKLDAKSGWYLEGTAVPFTGTNESDTGMHIEFDGRYYTSFGEDDRFTFATRLQVGSVPGGSLNNTPSDFLFYSGGGDTVRGQPYHSLGVTQNGVTTGGLSQAIANVELRAGIREKIELVGFYDIGYIGADPLPLTEGRSESGVGIGIRYETGLGPLRLDLAVPTTGEDRFGSVGVYAGIGQAF